MNEIAFNSRIIVRRFLWSYLYALYNRMKCSEKEEDFDVDNYIIVHENPITPDEFRHFSESQINVSPFVNPLSLARTRSAALSLADPSFPPFNQF